LFSILQNDETVPLMEEILRHRVEVLVLISSRRACLYSCLTAVTTAIRFSSVTSDNLMASAEIADFLISGGHRQMAFIAVRGTTRPGT
jgi:DNA-binding LacI/PurR family transcriptional regulator